MIEDPHFVTRGLFARRVRTGAGDALLDAEGKRCAR